MFGFRDLPFEDFELPRVLQTPRHLATLTEQDDLYQKSSVTRYSTFLGCPRLAWPSVCDFVDASFVYVGGPLRAVRCVFCNIILGQFLLSDNVDTIHTLLVPHCPRRTTYNIV